GDYPLKESGQVRQPPRPVDPASHGDVPANRVHLVTLVPAPGPLGRRAPHVQPAPGRRDLHIGARPPGQDCPSPRVRPPPLVKAVVDVKAADPVTENKAHPIASLRPSRLGVGAPSP